jgi:Tetrahydrofolate dehydrogenase/cyclohydrolase, catalytic domain/Formiminotransferase-cyclodeaminase
VRGSQGSLTTVRDETVEAFLGQLAARVPAPGGGATAALHAAQAAAVPGSGTASIRTALTELSGRADVHGIILQTPLPAGARLAKLAEAIDPGKDVDGANPASLGPS